MCKKLTIEELNKLDNTAKDDIIFTLQDRLDSLEKNYEDLIEQIRIANSERFGRKTEKLSNLIPGQLSFFNEAEAFFDETVEDPSIEEVIIEAEKKPRKNKQKGQREEDLRDFPQEEHIHDVSTKKLTETFGEGNYKNWKDDVYFRLRFVPGEWIAEKHIVKSYVGTGGLHQDEFLRGDRPKDLFRNSIATPSLVSAIINSKFVNGVPIDRMMRDFKANGLNLSKQTASNWIINSSEKYLHHVWEHMKCRMLKAHVNQCDETPVEVIQDGRPAGSKSYMWVHITGELSPDPKIVIYEYQKTRNSEHPREFYKDYSGILVTDGLSQYHKIDKEIPNLVNSNCWAHARRDFTNAIKALGKSNPDLVKRSLAYQALNRIATIYKLEESLKDLTPKERLKERQTSIKPLVEEYFAWIKECLNSKTSLPKGKTADGMQYSINQEKYLKVFLEDGEVPIDDSASERALRNFTIGRKNWMTIYAIKGAKASADIYSITETARLNNLNVYYYVKYLLEEIPKLIDENGNIEQSRLEELMPWRTDLPKDCYSKRRK